MSLFLRLEDVVAKLLLVAIVILVFLAGIARTVGHPLIWSVDFAQLLFIWLCFIGANRSLRNRAHIGVDYFVRALPPSLRRPLDFGLGLLTIAFLLAMAWTGGRLVLLNLERVYGDSGISYAWVTAAVPFGCLLMAVTLLQQLIGDLRGARQHDPAAAAAPGNQGV